MFGRTPRTRAAALVAVAAVAVACAPTPGPTEPTFPVAIATGNRVVCAEMDDGTARCWGYNRFEEIAPVDVDYYASPKLVEQLSGVVEVDPGHYPCALLDTGGVSCWGQASLNRPVALPNIPTIIPGVSDAIQIVTGRAHACALLDTGMATCWGSNDWGQLGDGTFDDRSTPAVVPGLADIVQLDAGASETCARLVDGTVECWGRQYGPNDEGSATPAPITGLTGATDISLEISRNTSHLDTVGCATTDAGAVRCWDGPALQGSTGGDALTDAVEVTVGALYRCARHADGTVSCWGSNAVGQLGDGTIDDAATPQPVEGLSGIVAVETSGYTTCAMSVTGSVWCWGSDDHGQLGQGTSGGIASRPQLVTANLT